MGPGKLKILIADDVLSNRKVLELILTKYGRCEIVADGAEAIEAFVKAFEAGEPFSLLCLDVIMPIKSGLEVLNEVRAFEKRHAVAENSQIKVLCLSSIDDKAELGSLLSDKSLMHIVKPIDPSQIGEILAKLGLI